MSFPTNIDSFTTHNIGDVINPDFDNDQQTAIVALETKVGVDGSVVTSTHDYKLNEVTGSDKAVGKSATQTLTNKTLTSPTISTPKITVGSDAVGDLHYTSNVDGTQSRLPIVSNRVLKSTGGVLVWEAEATTTDASSTVKGVVEIATASEITAGTATGGTGAALAITPDQLASSTPVFNGSGLTNVSKKLNITTSDSTVSGTGADTAFYTVSVPANTLGTNSGLVGKVYFEWVNSTTSAKTIKLKYGATTVATYTATPSGTTGMTISGYIDFMLLANGGTSAQEGSIFVNGVEGNQFFPTSLSNRIAFGGAKGTASEDSTTTLNLVLSVTQNSTETFTMSHGYVDLIK